MRIDVTVCRLPTGRGRKLYIMDYTLNLRICVKIKEVLWRSTTPKILCVWPELKWWENATLTKMIRRHGRKTGITSDYPIVRCKLEKPRSYWFKPKFLMIRRLVASKIQAVLAEYLIKVHNQHPKDGLVFPLQFKKWRETEVIHIYWDGDNHYDCITTVEGFLGCAYYCEFCDVGYINRGDHRCPDGCDGCYSDIACTSGRNIYCADGRRTFRSPACFDKHKLIKSNQKKSICQLVYDCDKCGIQIIGNKKKHVCSGQRKCKFCKEIVGPGHQCYIQKYQCKNQPNSEKEDEEEEQKSEQTSHRFIFFDFDSSQETGEHKVNFCEAQRALIIVWIYPRMNIAQPAVHYLEEERWSLKETTPYPTSVPGC